MLLTITTTYQPATDLGYLLHKHPERPQTFALAAGLASLFYPEASRQRCTAALLLEVDPLRLARGSREVLYAEEQPVVPASLLSVALARIFRTAMQGRCEARPDLTARMLPLVVTLSPLRCRGGAELIWRLFEPLGYTVDARALPWEQSAEEEAREDGQDGLYEITFSVLSCLVDVLAHLYILLPVLDHEKHYRIGAGEVDKLLRRGQNWLFIHPERAFIASRYLPGRPDLAGLALLRLQAERRRISHRADR